MSQLSKYLRLGQGGIIGFMCPGCKTAHHIQIGEGTGPRWGYNGNPESPTFTPSVLVRWYEPSELGWEMMDRLDPLPEGMDRYPGNDQVCHSYITDGKIQFLGDCTHALVNQTVELGIWPEAVIP